MEESRQGIRYTDLVKRIHDAAPDIKVNTIHGTIWNLEVQKGDKVYKPARGLFMHTMYRDEGPVEEKIPEPSKKAKANESAFYQPFADWIVNELEECTKAITVGGNIFKDKWGTPDVIGVRESKRGDIVKFSTEIVSVEIKIDTTSLITAFGQACAYRLFSHKSYIVVPENSPEDDLARLDTLCRIFGVGLILLNATNPKNPNFQIRVRATRHEPDMFYVNRYMKIVEDELFS